MYVFLELLALFAATIFGGVYVALNIRVARFLDRYGPVFWRKVIQPLGRRGQRQLRNLSALRIWCAIAVQVMAFALFSWFILSPQSLLSLTIGLTAYVLLVAALDISLMAQLPSVSRLWRDPAFG